MSILQQPTKLHRIGYGLVWAQAILGGGRRNAPRASQNKNPTRQRN